MSVVVYGASDDLIEVEGDVREEFNVYLDNDERVVLAFSEGTLLEVIYDRTGCWRIFPVRKGSATYSKVEAEGPDTKNYSDRVTLDGDIEWVVFGHHAGVRKRE